MPSAQEPAAERAPATGDTTDSLTRRTLLGRWALAGIAIPGALGALSWLCFEARMGSLFDALANLSLFAAPFWPFVLKTFQHHVESGAAPYLTAAAAVIANALLYLAVGTLHWRLRHQPTVNQWLWLTVVIGIGFSVLRLAAFIAASATG